MKRPQELLNESHYGQLEAILNTLTEEGKVGVGALIDLLAKDTGAKLETPISPREVEILHVYAYFLYQEIINFLSMSSGFDYYHRYDRDRQVQTLTAVRDRLRHIAELMQEIAQIKDVFGPEFENLDSTSSMSPGQIVDPIKGDGKYRSLFKTETFKEPRESVNRGLGMHSDFTRQLSDEDLAIVESAS